MAVVASTLPIEGGRVLYAEAPLVTYHVADTQFEHLGARGFTHNSLIKWLFPAADRSGIGTQTAGLFLGELLNHVTKDNEGHAQAIEVKGDVADTPLRSEIARLESVINRHNIRVEGYTRGNHSSGNVFGVVNRSSPWYARLRKLPLIGRFSLLEQLKGAAWVAGDILDQMETMVAMHRIVNWNRKKFLKPKKLTTAVHAADSGGYQLLGSEERVAFSPGNLDKNFRTFWKPSRGTQLGLNRETRFWECIVNYDIADEKHTGRGTKVNPIYLQASEVCRFRAEDETEYPVYTISIDGLDHKNMIAAIGGGVSELQVRLIETFIEERLHENKRARFKISSHFSAKDLTSVPWYMPWRRRTGKKAREAFRRLLGREEIVLYSFGHTHERRVTDLNKELKLGRKAPLMEINVPSLIDYRPSLEKHDNDYHDARALVVEKIRLREDPQAGRQPGDGRLPGSGRRLVIDLEYRGLDQDDVVDGKTEAVKQALETFSKNHGYIRARETEKMLRNKYLLGLCESHVKRLGEFLWYGVAHLFFRPGRWRRYWRELSVSQYAIDNLTVVSTVNMFNEAYHLLPFLESVAHFIKMDEEPGQLAIRGQLLGLRTALMEDYVVRRHEFEEALSNGERPGALKRYNDLFTRTRMHRLSNLLMRLRKGGEARAFAILAGLEASRQEFIYDKREPTTVPNQVPPISISV